MERVGYKGCCSCWLENLFLQKLVFSKAFLHNHKSFKLVSFRKKKLKKKYENWNVDNFIGNELSISFVKKYR